MIKRVLLILLLLGAAGGAGYYYWFRPAATEQAGAGGGRRRGGGDGAAPIPGRAARSATRAMAGYIAGRGPRGAGRAGRRPPGPH